MASQVPHCSTLIVKHTPMEVESYHEEMLRLSPTEEDFERKMNECKARFNGKEKEPCNAVIKPDIVFFGEPLPSVSL